MSEESTGRRTIMIAAVVAIIFIACSIWAYYKYVRPQIYKPFVENKEFTTGTEQPDTATIFFFGTEWCPHCKTAMKPWTAFKTEIGSEGGSVNGVNIAFREVDCDKEEKLAAQYDIKGYPTIKYARGDKVVEFDSKPTVATLKQFVDQMTTDE